MRNIKKVTEEKKENNYIKIQKISQSAVVKK